MTDANVVPAKVVWLDAAGGKTGWLDLETAQEHRDYVVTSYGWLIRNDKVVVTLAISRHATAHGDFMFADTLDVPRKMVKSVTKLKSK